MFSQTKTDLKLRTESVEPLVKSAKSAVSWSIGCKGGKWAQIGFLKILPASPSLETKTKR